MQRLALGAAGAEGGGACLSPVALQIFCGTGEGQLKYLGCQGGRHGMLQPQDGGAKSSTSARPPTMKIRRPPSATARPAQQ